METFIELTIDNGQLTVKESLRDNLNSFNSIPEGDTTIVNCQFSIVNYQE